MTPIERSIRRSTGYGDVFRPQPKSVKGAHWNRSIRAARLYANQWAREWVKSRYPRCVPCGSDVNLEWAHVLSGKGDAVRWEERNMTRQCTRCNQLHESHPEHLVAWFVQTYGQSALAELVAKAETLPKYTYSQIMEIGDKYRKLCKQTPARMGSG